MTETILTQQRLKEILNYYPVTGKFTWLSKGINKVKENDTAGCNKDGYIVIRVDTVLHRAHRLAWLYINGVFPAHEIDHINHIRNDNRISNLREVTHQENSRNSSINKNNTSGHTGVHFRKDTKKWVAQIMLDGKSVILGNFNEFDKAVISRKEAQCKYNFHDNHGA